MCDPVAQHGASRVISMIRSSARLVAEGGEDGAVISGKVLGSDKPNWGFDAQSGEFKDLVKVGIIDTTKVVRVTLQHAASVAGLLISNRGDRCRAARQEIRLNAARCRHGRHGLLIRLPDVVWTTGVRPFVGRTPPKDRK